MYVAGETFEFVATSCMCDGSAPRGFHKKKNLRFSICCCVLYSNEWLSSKIVIESHVFMESVDYLSIDL